MQYILVMRNNRLINKCVLLWYVDVLVSISPFRKISRAALVILSYLSCYLHVSGRNHGYGWMHFAGSREFQDLSWSSLWLLPLDLMVFQDLLWPLPQWWDSISRPSMIKSVCPTHSPPNTHTHTHTHTHIITEATSHKQSMLYWLQLEIQEIHFQNTCTRHFNIMVSTRKAHGADYKALCKTFLLESFKYTYLNS